MASKVYSIEKGESWNSLKAKIFKVFSDPNRLRIIELIAEEELNVSEIVRRLNMKQSTVSQHLRILKDCGLVSTRRNGKEVYYKIKSERIKELLKLGDEILVEIVESFVSCTCE